MRTIDQHTWHRREHFEFFRRFDHPHFNMCANVDLTAFLPYVKGKGENFTASLVYLITRTANDIPEFRQRIRHMGDDVRVVEHEVVHPSFTILAGEELFGFCYIEYHTDFSIFAARAANAMASASQRPCLDNPPGKDNLLFMTALPWVTFTSFTHPQHIHPIDSIPRFAWGKVFQQGGKQLMPLSVQGHHALMDGLHMARYYERIQGYFDNPGEILRP